MSTRHLLTSCLLLTAALGGAACSSNEGDSKGTPTDAKPDKPDPKTLTENPGSTVNCDEIIKGTTASDKAYVVKPGWADIPAAFQIVPPGGELCGSLYLSATSKTGLALMRSALYGQALADFYQPAATPSGCTLKVEYQDAGSFNTRTSLSATCGDKHLVIGTDTGYDFYTVTAF
jgi:hypothetical protein